MKELANYQKGTPLSVPNTAMGPAEVQIALGALHEVLGAAVTAAKNHEDAMTERAFIRAQKEVEIYAIEASTKRGMANDRDAHARKMEFISIVKALLVDNAQSLTPEILSAVQLVLTYMREE